MQAGVIEEFVSDAVDNALDSEDMEEEIEDEVDKVLAAIAGETAAELPEAVRKEKINVPAKKTSTSREVSTSTVELLQDGLYTDREIKSEKEKCNVLQEETIAEGVDDDEEELEETRARLAKVRS